jgi:hypothetical protein
MNKEFLKNVTSAFRSAGWLMIGTALMIAVGSLTIGVSPEVTRWGYGSIVVGGCIVLIDVVVSYLLRDKV